MEIKLAKGILRVAGNVDVVVLRAAIECFGRMIGPPAGTRIWIAAGVTDLRRGIYGSEWNGADSTPGDPFSGTTCLCFVDGGEI